MRNISAGRGGGGVTESVLLVCVYVRVCGLDNSAFIVQHEKFCGNLSERVRKRDGRVIIGTQCIGPVRPCGQLGFSFRFQVVIGPSEPLANA